MGLSEDIGGEDIHKYIDSSTGGGGLGSVVAGQHGSVRVG